MSQPTGRSVHRGIVDPNWQGLYIIGAAAAAIAVVFFRRWCGIELVAFQGFGIFDVPATHPTSALDWFSLLQDNRPIGLALFDSVDIVNYALVGLIYLALYGALRRTNKSAMVIATTFGFVGIAVYFASNQAFAMASLSDKYAAATTDVERAMFVAAGEALLAIHSPGTIHQGTGMYMSLFLVVLAGLISSVVMLRSSVFGKATAYVGILANGIALGHFLGLAFAPALTAVATPVSAPFRVLWYILIAIALFRLGRGRLRHS